MPKFSSPTKGDSSRIFGTVRRPLIPLRIWSPFHRRWLSLQDVLVDTGADISLLPREIGEQIIAHVREGKEFKIQGISPLSGLRAYIHQMTFDIAGMTFKSPVAIADSNNVPPILGRVKALDNFYASFQKGKRIILGK